MRLTQNVGAMVRLTSNNEQGFVPAPTSLLQIVHICNVNERAEQFGCYFFSQRTVNKWNNCQLIVCVNMFKNRIDNYLVRTDYT